VEGDMKEMISQCGLNCHECAAFKATKSDDDQKRMEVAAKWSKQYKADIRPEDINCEGCLSTGERVFSHCHVCEIRKCGIDKNVPNCAHCHEYICGKLEKFLKSVPGNRDLLEKVRKTLE
jgi:hypothetical protein